MIFGRRNLHRMLTAMSQYLESVRVQELLGRLQHETGQTRAAEWEVAIGYALSQIGTIRDPGQKNGRNLDFVWVPQRRPISIEVTSVSDVALHEHNPVQRFVHDLHRIASKLGIAEYGTFNYQFGSVEEQGRITVAVPSRNDHYLFFQRMETRAFFARIKSDPLIGHSYVFEERGASSTISYHPGKRFASSGGYRAYTIPQTYRHTPIFNALKKKERQVKESASTYPTIVFICDNDCDALSQSHTSSTGGRLGMRDIVGLFLNGRPLQMLGEMVWQHGVPAQASSIHAVIWISVKEHWEFLTARRTFALSANIEYATYADTYLRSSEFLSCLNEALSHLPVPLDTPRNAGNGTRYPRHYGGWTMSDTEIKFSALTLQKLLVGNISYEEFRRDHPELIAHLKRLNDQGAMIDFAAIEVCETEDDDWIKLRFGGSDPERLFSKTRS